MNILRLSDEDAFCMTIVGMACFLHWNGNEARERRYWERPHLGVRQRREHGQTNLLNEMRWLEFRAARNSSSPMRWNDEDSFHSLLRLRPESFDKLLRIVGPSITHYSNREPINPSTRLAATLRYLATGESKTSLSFTYRLGISTTDSIINETLVAIYNSLKPLVLPELTTEKWLEIADGFLKRWNVPNCSGALEGKHVQIIKPALCGSEYWNYKGFHSVVMMSISDAYYKFVATDVGCQGRNNDVVVLNNSDIYQKLLNNDFNLPGEKEIEDGPILPHFFLGDEIFGLQPHLMVPYPGRGTGKLSYNERIFNYRQSRGRRVVENMFGIFVNVWRIFLTKIHASPDVVDRIVLAAVCLHNFRIMENEDIEEFIPPCPGSNLRRNRMNLHSINSISIQGVPDASNEGEYVRDELAKYFANGGRVYWQDSLINR